MTQVGVDSVRPHQPTIIAMVGGSGSSATGGANGGESGELEEDEYEGHVIDDGLGEQATAEDREVMEEIFREAEDADADAGESRSGRRIAEALKGGSNKGSRRR